MTGTEQTMPHRVSLEQEYQRIEDMSGMEREALIKRTARLVFEEEFSRDTTQTAISKTAESVFRKIDLQKIIRDTAIEVSNEVSKTTAREVVSEAFRLMDIDPNSRDETRDFRDDIRFIRSIRKLVGDSWTKALGIVFLSICLAGVYGAWKHFVSGPPAVSVGNQAAPK